MPGTIIHFAPHPDDEALGAPATLLRCVREGWRVVNVAVSLGRPDQHGRRRAEAEEACATAGFELVVLEPPGAISSGDDLVIERARLADEFAVLIAQHDAAIVVSPSPHDGHHGHVVVGRAAADALMLRPGTPWWMWGLWADLPRPTIYSAFDDDDLEECVRVLREHREEVERNDFVKLLRARAEANAVLGSERVFGFGAAAASKLPYAELLIETQFDGVDWIRGVPRMLPDAGVLPSEFSAERLTNWVTTPSVREHRAAPRRGNELSNVALACRAAACAAAGAASPRLQQLGDVGECAVYPMPGHIGSSALAVDGFAHTAAERAIYRGTNRHVVILGEEVTRTIAVEPGDWVFAIDSVDGTAPATHLIGGWSSVVLGWTFEGADGWKLLGGAIATGDGRVATLEVTEGGAIVSVGQAAGDAAEDRVIAGPASPSSDGILSVAVVGHKASRQRAFFDAASAFARGTMAFNLGGSPTVMGLLVGNLGAAVALERQTPWDAAHVLFTAAAGGAVATLADARLRTLADVERWFREPPTAQGEVAKTIPPCVVSPSAESALAIACQLGARRQLLAALAG